MENTKEFTERELEFLKIYNEPRNGTENFYFDRMFKNFLFSDGFKELIQWGCHWLYVKLATELPELQQKYGDGLLILTIEVSENSKALITGAMSDETIEYKEEINYTDIPQGIFKFYIFFEEDEDESNVIRIILPKEY